MDDPGSSLLSTTYYAQFSTPTKELQLDATFHLGLIRVDRSNITTKSRTGRECVKTHDEPKTRQ